MRPRRLTATRPGAVRGWASVHPVTPGLSILAGVAVLSWLFGSATVARAGPIWFATPVSALLLFPVLAGSAVAIACDNTARVPLPDPPRATAARAGWISVWTVLAVLASNSADSVLADVDPVAITRNVLLYVSLGTVVVRFGVASMIWLPATAYTIICLVFGHPIHGHPAQGQGYYWWAVVLDAPSTVTQTGVVALIFVTAVIGYAVRFTPRRPVGRGAAPGADRGSVRGSSSRRTG